MSRLIITSRPYEGTSEVAILQLKGDFDTTSIEKVSGLFDSLVAAKRCFVILDAMALFMISSAALGELMGGRKRLVEAGGELVICGLNLDLKTRLTLMGANKIFKFYPDVRSAVNAYEWQFKGKLEQVKVDFPPSLKFVPAVRQLVSRVARQKGYSNKDAFRIETIVDEICNNAVEHRQSGNNQNIGMSVGIDRSKIEISVSSMSDPHKAETLKNILKPQFEKPDDQDIKRGRGLALIKLLCADLNINFSGTGTSVRATKLKEG